MKPSIHTTGLENTKGCVIKPPKQQALFPLGFFFGSSGSLWGPQKKSDETSIIAPHNKNIITLCSHHCSILSFSLITESWRVTVRRACHTKASISWSPALFHHKEDSSWMRRPPSSESHRRLFFIFRASESHTCARTHTHTTGSYYMTSLCCHGILSYPCDSAWGSGWPSKPPRHTPPGNHG